MKVSFSHGASLSRLHKGVLGLVGEAIRAVRRHVPPGNVEGSVEGPIVARSIRKNHILSWMDIGVVGVVARAVHIGLINQIRIVHFCQASRFVDGVTSTVKVNIDNTSEQVARAGTFVTVGARGTWQRSLEVPQLLDIMMKPLSCLRVENHQVFSELVIRDVQEREAIEAWSKEVQVSLCCSPTLN